MSWQKGIVCLLACSLAFFLGGCTSSEQKAAGSPEKVQLMVFAAASMTETLTEIAHEYEAEHPEVEIAFNFDSSGTLKTQIENGARADLFISAAPRQMDQLDISQAETKNPQRLDFLQPESRINLLENKVVLVTPTDNPQQIQGFADWAEKLKHGSLRLAMGNSDVPVGQYTQKILHFYQLDEQALAQNGQITYGANVKEVTTQVKEKSADCGIIYETDAYSAGLTPLATATEAMCGQVIYPVAILKNSQQKQAAAAFLTYLQGEKAKKIFRRVGFTPLT